MTNLAKIYQAAAAVQILMPDGSSLELASIREGQGSAMMFIFACLAEDGRHAVFDVRQVSELEDVFKGVSVAPKRRLAALAAAVADRFPSRKAFLDRIAAQDRFLQPQGIAP